MLWFFESSFPVVLIAFIVYGRIKVGWPIFPRAESTLLW
jgi:hypothetical protein